MDEEATRERVLRILAEVTGSQAVLAQPDLDLFASGLLDSLGTVGLMAALEEQLGIAVSPASWDRSAWATPARLAGDVVLRAADPEPEGRGRP